MPGIEGKGRSPFYPDQPVPVELFIGRQQQLQHILQRGVGQVSAGKPVYMFLEGEYGIGKTSIAHFAQWKAEREYGLLAIYATLDRVESMDDVGEAILNATLRSGAYDPKLGEKIRNGMADFIEQASFLSGTITLKLDALRREAPKVTSGFLPFLAQTLERVKADGIRGVFLVMDEINGIANNPKFAHFLKGIVESNAAVSLGQPTLPILLMLCGVEERRGQLIASHEPVERIFDVIHIERMALQEMMEFFRRAFDSVNIMIEPSALGVMADYAAGFPKVMHLIGNAAFWRDEDGRIDENDALDAVLMAADEVGKRYVNQQVIAALRSNEYRSILNKIAKVGPNIMRFTRAEVAAGLTDTERKKFDNFLQKMKQLHVLRPGEVKGEYVFTMRMARFYIWLEARRKERLQL